MLKGDGFIIRNWRAGDEESLAENADNKKIWDNLVDVFPHPYTIKDAEEWIKKGQIPERIKTDFAIEINGKAVGGIGGTFGEKDHRNTITFGYWLGEKYWGKGIMTKAIKLFSDYVFKNFEIERLQAYVYPWNPASARVLEKCGFVYEGTLRKNTIKDGKVVDEAVYSKIRG
jgi:[ribosomal protein S5]-alanine N-acetyltransferase